MLWHSGLLAAVLGAACVGVQAQLNAPCSRSSPIALAGRIAGLTDEVFTAGTVRAVNVAAGGVLALHGAHVTDGANTYVDGCNTGMFFADPLQQITTARDDLRLADGGGDVLLEGSYRGSRTWVVSLAGLYTTIRLAPGPPAQLRAIPALLTAKLGYILPPVGARVTDYWGNPTPIARPVAVSIGCRYIHGAQGYELYGGVDAVVPTSGEVTFTNLIAKGRLGVCVMEVTSDHLVTWTAGRGESCEVTLVAGDAHEVRIAPTDASQYERNFADDAYVAATDTAFNVSVEVVDIGGNALDYPVCLEPGAGPLVINEKLRPAFGVAGSEDCVLLNIVWRDAPGTFPPTPRDKLAVITENTMRRTTVEIDPTVEEGTGAYELREVVTLNLPAFIGSALFEARLSVMKTTVTNRINIQSMKRGEFKCLNSSLGQRLFTTHSIAALLDETSQQAITRTFFDPEIPPPPFVRFNISYMDASSYEYYYNLPAKFQYWVLMSSPFYVQLDPVLTTYFCFGFSYARVDDIFLYLRQPFCRSTTQEEVTPQLSSLLFDVGDASQRYHESHPPRNDNFQWTNFSGYVAKAEGLSICVGDRILSPATTGYDIDCCSREQGTCLQNEDTVLFHTLIIALLSGVATLAAVLHTKYLVSCLQIPLAKVPPLDAVDPSRKAKIIFVHILMPIFPFFSVVVNWPYVHYLHPLIILWLVELYAGCAAWFVFALRLHPEYAHTPLWRRLYQMVLLQIALVSLWLLWAAFVWAFTTVFLETRRALVPFLCFAMMLIYCITKPGVISEFHDETLGLFSVSDLETVDMLLEAATVTAGFAVFLSAVVYSISSLPVISDTHIIIAIVIVVVATFFLNLSLFETISTTMRRTLQGTADTVTGYVGESLGIEGVTRTRPNQALTAAKAKGRRGTLSITRTGSRALGGSPDGTGSPVPQNNTEVVLKALQGALRDKWGRGGDVDTPTSREGPDGGGETDSKRQPLLRNEADTPYREVESVGRRGMTAGSRFFGRLFGSERPDDAATQASPPLGFSAPEGPRGGGSPAGSVSPTGRRGSYSNAVAAKVERLLSQGSPSHPPAQHDADSHPHPPPRRWTVGAGTFQALPAAHDEDPPDTQLAESFSQIPELHSVGVDVSHRGAGALRAVQPLHAHIPRGPVDDAKACSPGSPMAFSKFADEAERLLDERDPAATGDSTASHTLPSAAGRTPSTLAHSPAGVVTVLRLRRSPIDSSDAPLGFHCAHATLELERVDRFTPAWFCGMAPCVGQRLVAVNGDPVHTTHDVRAAVAAAGPYAELRLHFSKAPPAVHKAAEGMPLSPLEHNNTSWPSTTGGKARSKRGSAALRAPAAASGGILQRKLFASPTARAGPRHAGTNTAWVDALSRQRESMRQAQGQNGHQPPHARNTHTHAPGHERDIQVTVLQREPQQRPQHGAPPPVDVDLPYPYSVDTDDSHTTLDFKRDTAGGTLHSSSPDALAPASPRRASTRAGRPRGAGSPVSSRLPRLGSGLAATSQPAAALAPPADRPQRAFGSFGPLPPIAESVGLSTPPVASVDDALQPLSPGTVLRSGIIVGESYVGPRGEPLLTWSRPAAAEREWSTTPVGGGDASLWSTPLSREAVKTLPVHDLAALQLPDTPAASPVAMPAAHAAAAAPTPRQHPLMPGDDSSLREGRRRSIGSDSAAAIATPPSPSRQPSLSQPRHQRSASRQGISDAPLPRTLSSGALRQLGSTKQHGSSRSLKDALLDVASVASTGRGSPHGSVSDKRRLDAMADVMANVVKYAPRLREHASQGMSPRGRDGTHSPSRKETLRNTARAVASGVLEDAVHHVAQEIRNPRSEPAPSNHHSRIPSRDSATGLDLL